METLKNCVNSAKLQLVKTNFSRCLQEGDYETEL